jgi:hypothetical protein
MRHASVQFCSIAVLQLQMPNIAAGLEFCTLLVQRGEPPDMYGVRTAVSTRDVKRDLTASEDHTENPNTLPYLLAGFHYFCTLYEGVDSRLTLGGGEHSLNIHWTATWGRMSRKPHIS